MPITLPRRVTGIQFAITRTRGVQPSDWQYPFMAQMKSRNSEAVPAPKQVTVHGLETSEVQTSLAKCASTAWVT